MKTTKELWDTDNACPRIIFGIILLQTISDSILNDKFFSQYMDEKSKTKFIKMVHNVKFSEKLRNKINYLKRNPFFMFTKGFWIRTGKRITKPINK